VASGQLSDLRTLVKANIGNRDDKDALITKWLNQASLEVAQRHGWAELEKRHTTFATAAATKTTAKPSDMMRPVSLVLQDGSNSRPLIPVLIEEYNRMWPRPETDATGRPSHYALWDESFYWYRIPDAIYTIYADYVIPPTAFIHGTDASTTELTRLDEVLVAGTTYRAFRSLQQYEDYRFWLAEYEKLLSKAIADRNERRDGVFVLGRYEAVRAPIGDYWKYPHFGK